MSRVKDMTGERFGSLVVVERAENNHRGLARWKCKCDCGRETIVNGADLRSGLTKSCGDKIHKAGVNLHNLVGKRYGRLVVIKRAKNDKMGRVRWLCQCDCGNQKIVRRSSLQSGLTKSCGCWLKDNPSNVSHRMSKTRVYGIWCAVKDRCYNTNVPTYKNYGGRGIAVCEEWRNDPIAFIEWAYENGYSDDLSIDRIDVNGNYEPSNCRWADIETQANNKRNTVFITCNGETHNLKEWSEITGIKHSVIYNRYRVYGWSAERALGYV